MRKLKIIEHISLDGVIQNSADGGDFPYTDLSHPRGPGRYPRRAWLRSAAGPTHLRCLVELLAQGAEQPDGGPTHNA